MAPAIENHAADEVGACVISQIGQDVEVGGGNMVAGLDLDRGDRPVGAFDDEVGFLAVARAIVQQLGAVLAVRQLLD